ncbi:protein spaetzle 5 isoform X2 [Phymastichus coffea]|uniref:protein spaetzle 5 isoform X2 n=1 Tax=Phymastichus coffea TaxID=108790 RepID=UPI00273CD9FD|nr:protein spaetzle 5 isoform X2 [Phymastichus coffea]
MQLYLRWAIAADFASTSSASGYVNHKPCPKYGCPLAAPIHEQFVPAPPGYTPKCAKPGLTFCESLDRYPQQLIQYLIEKQSVDLENFLRDESSENFDAFRRVPSYEGAEEQAGEAYEAGYDYPRPEVPPAELYPQSSPALHLGVPPNATNNRYLPVPAHPGRPLLAQSRSASGRQSHGHHHHHRSPEPFERLAPWASRGSRGAAAGYTRYRNPLLEFAARQPRARSKRQSEANAVSICPTRSQFVSPRAALNNQGNWMYVVNLEEQSQHHSQHHSQLVKSELCVSDTCDGLCSLPLGYTSRCQQQYVQKRLVALGGGGDRLYTDVFWFPHGCMCQVSLEY